MLLDEERRAVLKWVMSLNVGTLELFLAAEGLPNTKVLGAALNPDQALVAVGFARWLADFPDKAPAVLAAALVETPDNDHAKLMKKAGERLLFVKNKQDLSGPPHEARLARSVPIVNRTLLRNFLDDAVKQQSAPVFVVRGDSGLGRTHSWHLINHVAERTGAAKVVKADMISPTLSDQKLEVLFDFLVGELELEVKPPPSSDGVTSDTLAARYAAELATRIRRKAPYWAKPVWIVFDSVDRPVRPEIKRFVTDLAQMRLTPDFDRCVLFILGPDPTVPLNDPYLAAGSEPIGGFTAAEVTDAVETINKLGSAPLKAAALKDRITELTGLLQARSGRDLCEAVATALVKLRVEVKA